MKRNWYAIIAILIALFVWQVFVINPHNKKLLEQQKVLNHREEKNNITESSEKSSEKLVLLEKQSSEKILVNIPSTTLSFLDSQDFSKSKLFKIGPDRTIRIFENGSLAKIEFLNYRVRASQSRDHVSILNHGLHWRASSPQISECLAILKKNQHSTSEKLEFSAQTSNGICALEYTLKPENSGLIQSKLILQGFSESAQTPIEFSGLDFLGDSVLPDEHNSLYLKISGSLKKLKDKDLLRQETHEGQVDWMSWGDKYFMAAVIPRGQYNPNIRHQKSSVGDKWIQFSVQYPYVGNSSQSMNIEMDLYFGTKDPSELVKIHPTLDQAVELGFAASVAKLMLWALKGINNLLTLVGINNFGISIILLTILVRVLFWPLNKKVFISGQKMKQLQPKIQALREKYGNDKSQLQAMNMEMMGLYKKYNVNPLGSCLPVLLQMPIFIGLYGALSHSLDLYQAPFFGWIQDLSSKDPYYIFPILWTLSLLVYIKLNPIPQQPGQPDMKWIMIAMNLFFGFLSKDWPAGLTLYLFVSNLVGIAQQIHFLREVKCLKPLEEGA